MDLSSLVEFTEEDIIRDMYDGTEDNSGLVCIIPYNKLKEKYRKPEYQLFRVMGGFGCSPDKMGNACVGHFCYDGEDCRWERYDFIGVGNDKVQQIGKELEEGLGTDY